VADLAGERTYYPPHMMHHVDTVEHGQTLEADLCIVGAGAAGLTIAREFANGAVDVIMVESGEIGVDDAYEQLNDGEVGSTPFVGLREGRRRGFGGTTAAWGGQCCELDADDFVARPWVPNSGWPIGQDVLEPYYRRAEHVFGVDGESYGEANWRRFRVKPVPLDRAELYNSFSVFSPHPRLGKFYRRLLADARNIRIFLGATAYNIRTNETGSRATTIDVKSLTGRQVQVRARAFVLCTGTVESARLLLASCDTAPRGLGNDRDVVGRYFQDHPTSYTGFVQPTRAVRLQDAYGVLYRGRTWYWPKMALAPERQRKARTLNASAFLSFEYDSSAIEVLRMMVQTTRTGGRFVFSGERLLTLVRGTPAVIAAGYRRYVLGRSPSAKPSRIALACSIEQAPNPDSRVTLSDSRDRFGMRRPRVDWKITDAERHTFRVITNGVDAEFRRLNLGMIERQPWLDSDDDTRWKYWDNYHQTGTARMSADPAYGVVDVNCQVHGVEGLFVAGAPTFPTSGYANPVLTIAAISIRLSDHLKRVVAVV
jgi:choline dehydrogenase-like flavoprotein